MADNTAPVPNNGSNPGIPNQAQVINGGPALGSMQVGGYTPPIPLGVPHGLNAPRHIEPARTSGPAEPASPAPPLGVAQGLSGPRPIMPAPTSGPAEAPASAQENGDV